MDREKWNWIIGLVLAGIIVWASYWHNPLQTGFITPMKSLIGMVAFFGSVIALVGIGLRKKPGGYFLALSLALLLLASLITFTELAIQSIPIENEGEVSLEDEMPEGMADIKILDRYSGKLERPIFFFALSLAGFFIASKAGLLAELESKIRKKIGLKKFILIVALIFAIVIFFFNVSELAYVMAVQGNTLLCPLSEEPAGCVIVSAITTMDESKCSHLSDPEKSSCIMWTAIAKNEPELCETIPEFKEPCYSVVAGINGDAELCEHLKIAEGREECADNANLAAGKCDRIVDTEKRETCYWRMARDTKDTQYCEGLADKQSQDKCKEIVSQSP